MKRFLVLGLLFFITILILLITNSAVSLGFSLNNHGEIINSYNSISSISTPISKNVICVSVDKKTGRKLKNCEVALSRNEIEKLRKELIKEKPIRMQRKINFYSGVSLIPIEGKIEIKSEDEKYYILQLYSPLYGLLSNLDDDTRNKILNLVKILDATDNYAYIVEIPKTSFPKLRKLVKEKRIRYIGSIQPEMKINRRLLNNINHKPKEIFNLSVFGYKKFSDSEKEELRRLFNFILFYDDVAEGSVAGKNVVRLLDLNFVKRVSEVSSMIVQNLESTMLVGNDFVWASPDGYDGSDIVIGIVDTGIAQKDGIYHPDLPSSKIIDQEDFTIPTHNLARDFCGHGTHVAGILAGNGEGSDTYGKVEDKRWRGVAPGAKLLIYKLLSSTIPNLPIYLNYALERAAKHKVNIISSSIDMRVFAGKGEYGSGSKYIDRAVRGYYTDDDGERVFINYVQAAGNNDCGPISSFGVNKNGITVGAVIDGYPSQGDIGSDWPPTKISSYSSCGPVDTDKDSFTRIKPDVVAPGGDDFYGSIVSTVPWYKNECKKCVGSDSNICSSDYYFGTSGTSMATPIVAGSIALFLESTGLLLDYPESVKAHIISTAIPLGEKSKYGYGIIDSYHMIYDDESFETLLLVGSMIDENDPVKRFEFDVPSNFKEVRVALTWSDPPGSKEVYNDLDLKIYDANNNLVGSSESYDDVVEYVKTNTGVPGNWHVDVLLSSSDGDFPQFFGLSVVSVKKQPSLSIEVSSNKEHVIDNEKFTITATVNNDGYTATGVYLSIEPLNNFYFAHSYPIKSYRYGDKFYSYSWSNLPQSPWLIPIGEIVDGKERIVKWELHRNKDSIPNGKYTFIIKAHAKNANTVTKTVTIQYCKNADDPECNQCSCSSWQARGCGEGSCSSDERLYTRTCNPSGCDIESKCEYDADCESEPEGCPVEGYRYCHEKREPPAFAMIYWRFEDDKGVVNPSGYVTGHLYAKVGHRGDQIYFYKNILSWDDIRCDKYGCDGTPKNPGRHLLASKGQKYTDCPVYLDWDYEGNQSSWVWVWSAEGWLGNGNCLDIKVVECKDNEDCGNNWICDKSGDWKDWHCVYCSSHASYKCYNNDVYWYDSCGNREEKKEECGSDSCGSWGNNYCKYGDVYHKRTCYDRGCSNNICFEDSRIEEEKVEDCNFGCENGKCKPENNPPTTPTNILCDGEACDSRSFYLDIDVKCSGSTDHEEDEITYFIDAYYKTNANIDYESWWDTNWDKRRKITITEKSGKNLSDYTVRLNIVYDSDMQYDFEDLRFVQGNTELNYWVQEKVNGDHAIVLVNIPFIPASSSMTIYMYYSNPLATYNGSFNKVVVFGDDFEDGVFDDYWTKSWCNEQPCSTFTASTEKPYTGEYSLKIDDKDSSRLPTTEYTISFASALVEDLSNTGFLFHVNVFTNTSHCLRITFREGGLLSNIVGFQFFDNIFHSPEIQYLNSAHQWSYIERYNDGTWYSVEIKATNSKQDVYVNGMLKAENQNIASYNLASGFRIDSCDGAGVEYIDNIYIIKYTKPEPTYSIGSEESHSGYSWNFIGNHREGSNLYWSISNLPEQSEVKLRCRAKDVGGSNKFSAYYSPQMNITISSEPIKTCIDECSLGQKRCKGNYKQICGNFDNDKCLEWGGDVFCEYGCSNGICVQPSKCMDSDGGIDYYKKGTVSANGKSYTDYCLKKRKLKEYFCDGDDVDWVYKKCSRGYKCSNGACVEKGGGADRKCTDSDGGLSYYTKGKVTYRGRTYTDYCKSSKKLKEFYCKKGKVKSKKKKCICSDGKCV